MQLQNNSWGAAKSLIRKWRIQHERRTLKLQARCLQISRQELSLSQRNTTMLLFAIAWVKFRLGNTKSLTKRCKHSSMPRTGVKLPGTHHVKITLQSARMTTLCTFTASMPRHTNTHCIVMTTNILSQLMLLIGLQIVKIFVLLLQNMMFFTSILKIRRLTFLELVMFGPLTLWSMERTALECNQRMFQRRVI